LHADGLPHCMQVIAIHPTTIASDCMLMASLIACR